MDFTRSGLQRRHRRVERQGRPWAFALVLPATAFLALVLVVPIVSVLLSAVWNPTIRDNTPTLYAAIQGWNGEGMPPVAVVAALVNDLTTATSRGTVGRVAIRLNWERSGYRSLVLNSAAVLRSAATREGRDAVLLDPAPLTRLVRIDARWGEREIWSRLRQAAPPLTFTYLLRAVDRKLDLAGEVVPVHEHYRLYVDTFWRTVEVCTVVTLICLLVGLPVAGLIAGLPPRYGNWLILLVVLPIYTSLIVKTLAWMMMLQNQGLLNDAGRSLGLWDEPIPFAYTRIGTYFAMVHILLPFAILPLYAVMRRIDPYHLKAASIMGAGPLRVFWRIFLPQAVPGIWAGALLVFVLALGLYVPASFIGVPSDRMLGYYVVQAGAGGGLSGALALLQLTLLTAFLLAMQRTVRNVLRRLA